MEIVKNIKSKCPSTFRNKYIKLKFVGILPMLNNLIKLTSDFIFKPIYKTENKFYQIINTNLVLDRFLSCRKHGDCHRRAVEKDLNLYLRKSKAKLEKIKQDLNARSIEFQRRMAKNKKKFLEDQKRLLKTLRSMKRYLCRLKEKKN